MSRKRPTSMLLLFLVCISFCQAQEDRALAYLAGEVPKWSVENKCFSCHNNGDGARALFVALKSRRKVDTEALESTNAWLRRPADWQAKDNNPIGSDKLLAVIQFAAALVEAPDSDRKAISQAAELLATQQKTDGTWRIDTGSVGSPVTYGTGLATFFAKRTLEVADKDRYKDTIERVNAWFAKQRPTNVPDMAATMFAGASDFSDLLVTMQNRDGGWGPWKNAPSEPFDTALALLALQPYLKGKAAIAGGRSFLKATQETSGGWPATTRPPGNLSYAQHISTTAWATIALLRTNTEGN